MGGCCRKVVAACLSTCTPSKRRTRPHTQPPSPRILHRIGETPVGFCPLKDSGAVTVGSPRAHCRRSYPLDRSFVRRDAHNVDSSLYLLTRSVSHLPPSIVNHVCSSVCSSVCCFIGNGLGERRQASNAARRLSRRQHGRIHQLHERLLWHEAFEVQRYPGW